MPVGKSFLEVAKSHCEAASFNELQVEKLDELIASLASDGMRTSFVDFHQKYTEFRVLTSEATVLALLKQSDQTLTGKAKAFLTAAHGVFERREFDDLNSAITSLLELATECWTLLGPPLSSPDRRLNRVEFQTSMSKLGLPSADFQTLFVEPMRTFTLSRVYDVKTDTALSRHAENQQLLVDLPLSVVLGTHESTRK